MADWSSDESLFRTPLIPDFQTFKKKWIVPSYETNADSISLGDWVDAQEPGQGDLMLQMDIEGNEYGVLSDCSPSLIKRFRIILIELHGLRQAARPSGLDSSKRNALQMLLLHHTVIHVHPNNAGGIEPLPFFPFEVPSTLEVTAVRSDWLSELTSSIDSAPQLPHELDIAWNTSGKPPLFLNKSWCGGTINESCQQRRDRIMESWEKSRAKRA